MSELSKEQRLATKTGAIDELSIQNMLQKRHKQNYPFVILQLTKRVQSVNQTWNKVMWQVMNIPGLSINYSKAGDKLLITVTYKHPGKAGIPLDEVELHEITVPELMTAGKYIEVAIMDKLDKSELIARLDSELTE
jgi:hypothetical protein